MRADRRRDEAFSLRQNQPRRHGDCPASPSEPGRIHTNINVVYHIKLCSKFTWNISFYSSWDNQPPPGFSSSDYGSSSGISYKFGNR